MLVYLPQIRVAFALTPTLTDVGQTITSLPGQLVGYIRPAAGLGGQISANVQVLVASGGVQGSMTFAELALPVGGAVYVASITPSFSASFGDSLTLTGNFLNGNVQLWVSIWNCCCWYCGWSCCFRCGGSCNVGYPGSQPLGETVLTCADTKNLHHLLVEWHCFARVLHRQPSAPLLECNERE